MEIIYPVTAQQCGRWVGRPVCVVLGDDSFYIGYLRQIRGGKLYLADKKTTTHSAKPKQTTGLQSGNISIDLDWIAGLYAIPSYLFDQTIL